MQNPWERFRTHRLPWYEFLIPTKENKTDMIVPVRLIMIASAIIVMAVDPRELAASTGVSRDVSKRNEVAVLEALRPIISASNKAIRVYYRASACATNGDDEPVPFPSVKLRPAKAKTGVAAVREIFGDDRNVAVTEEPPGTIRVWIGKVTTTILQTKLTSIDLSPFERYNQTMAIAAIQDTKELQGAARALRLMAVADAGGLVAHPAKGLPHLPAVIRDVTVDQALDLVASTFRNVVVFGMCSNSTGPDAERAFWIE